MKNSSFFIVINMAMLQCLIAVCLTLSLVSAASYRYNARDVQAGEFQGACEYDEDCMTSFAFCKNNRVCDCRRYYQYDGRSDACYSTQLGQRCNADQDCSLLPNARCIDGLCQCRSDHVATEKEVAGCLPERQLQAECQDDVQCRAADENSHCNTTSSKCDCLPGFHTDFQRGQCLLTKRLRDSCTKHEQCASVAEQQDKVECRRDNDNQFKCLCRNGFSQSRSSVNICVRGADGGGAASITGFAATVVVAIAAVAAALR